MATKKAGGASKNGRDSNSKRLGVKVFGGQACKAGSVIVRQKGSVFRAGDNVETGRDYTLFSVKEGVVKFSRKKVSRFDGRKYERNFVSVV